MLTFTLSDILTIVQKGQKALFGGFSFWLKTEIHKIRKVGNNHYCECIEFDQHNNVKAKLTGIIFDPDIVAGFQRTTKINLLATDNITLLIQGKLNFHQSYGTSVIISEISSQYSLGNIVEQKKHILQTLEKEGISQSNKNLTAPVPPLHVALITGRESQGAKDFVSILESSQYNFSLSYYETIIHGNGAKESVVQALQKIKQDCIDVPYSYVVLARGGGESSGMLRQNDETIARHICSLGIPVVVAIGHTQDTSVLDEICYQTAKTPTDAGYICVQLAEEYNQTVHYYIQSIHTSIEGIVANYQKNLEQLYEKIMLHSQQRFEKIHHNIEKRYTTILQKDPSLIKKQGYGIIRQDGEYITPQTLQELKVGQELGIDIYDHTLTVKIIEKKKQEE